MAILINTDNERKVHTTQLEVNHDKRELYPELVGAVDHLGPNITRELRLAESHYHRFDNLVCIDKTSSSIKRKFGETSITAHLCKDQVGAIAATGAIVSDSLLDFVNAKEKKWETN